MRSAALGVAALIVLGGCRSAEVETGPGPGAQPAPPTADALPAGSILEVELNQTIGTNESRVGERFTATVTEPIVARNGQVVVPRGSTVSGVVTGLDPSERIGDQAAIRVNFDRIAIRGTSYPFSAEVVDTDVELEGEVERGVTGAAIGAVAGAALGAIIGGDAADILIGGALGAGAGTIISLGIGQVDAKLPAGTDMTLRTTRNISLR